MSDHNPQLASVNHRFFWGQILVQVLLIFLALSQAKGAHEMLSVFAISALVLIGVPHGGNDYFYRPDKSLRGSLKFLFFYLGCMGLYAGLWQWLPLLSLLLFLAISMHHFGQSNFLSDRWTAPESLLWGCWLLVFPMVRHLEEALGIFAQMMGGVEKGFHDPVLGDANLFIASVCFGVLYGWVLWKRRIEHRWQFLLQWALVTLWFWVSPLIMGFVVVFCLWHAAQSMRYQVMFIRQSHSRSIGRVLLDFMPLGLLAVLAWVFSAEFDVMQHLGWGFVLLSLVTLPHVVVMDGIYRTESHR